MLFNLKIYRKNYFLRENLLKNKNLFTMLFIEQIEQF